VDRAVAIVTLQGVPSVLRDLGMLAGGWDKVAAAQSRANAVASKFLLAGGTIAGAMFLIGRASLDASAQIEAVRVGLETMLGSAAAARKMLSEWKNFALLSPYDFQQIARSGQLLLAMGIHGSELMKVLHGVGEAAAAAGGGTERYGRALYAIGEIRSIGTLQARQLRMLATAGIPAQEILKEKLKLTDKDFENIGNLHIPAQKAIDALLEGFEERYPGAMEKLNKTLKGQLSQLRDMSFQTAAALGDVFNKDATHAISGMTHLLMETKKFIELHPRLIEWGATFAGIAATVLILVGGFLKVRNMMRDLFGITPKSAQGKGNGTYSTQNMFVAAMNVYINGPIRGGYGGPPSPPYPPRTGQAPGEGGGYGTQPLPGGAGSGSGALPTPMPWWRTLLTARNFIGVLAGAAIGYQAYDDLSRAGYNKRNAALPYGLSVGGAVASTALWPEVLALMGLTSVVAPFALPAAIVGGAAAFGINRFYNRPLERQAEQGNGLTEEETKEIAGKSYREKADQYFKLRDRLLGQGDETGALSALYEANKWRRFAERAEMAALKEREARELQAWGVAQDARLRAEEEAKYGSRYNLSPQAARLAEMFGVVPESDYRDNRKVKVKTLRDNEDNTHIGFTIPATRGDRLERNLRFGLTTPAPAL
jgi:tape measure domain-containing protein